MKPVAYVYSDVLRDECNRLPTMLNRASIVQDLIEAYGLLSDPRLYVVKSFDATEDELKLFHSSSYVDFLKKVNDKEDFEDFEEEQQEFGLGYDCPILEGNYDFAKTIAGGSLTAAKLLAGDKCQVAINWFGGWHHAQRDGAEGFCYVNDIVLAIQKLTEKFDRILYVDLDIHHGNGVQNAFELSKKIVTLSFHKFAAGFYPGSGDLNDTGIGKGKYYSINVPFRDGLGAKPYEKAFSEIFHRVFTAFKPKVLVVQCGADGLNGDKIGETNLTLESIGECIKKVLACELPTLFLGGGGYNFANTARLWTYLTSLILKRDLDNDIPADAEYFTKFAPSYELHIDGGHQKDFNTEVYVDMLISTVSCYCDLMQQ